MIRRKQVPQEMKTPAFIPCQEPSQGREFSSKAMALRYIRPPADPRGDIVALPLFLQVPAGAQLVDFQYCMARIWDAAEAIRKATISGVVEYHIGSRGLKRFTLAELQDSYAFWKNAAQDALAEGVGSSIQSRRAVLCDV